MPSRLTVNKYYTEAKPVSIKFSKEFKKLFGQQTSKIENEFLCFDRQEVELFFNNNPVYISCIINCIDKLRARYPKENIVLDCYDSLLRIYIETREFYIHSLSFIEEFDDFWFESVKEIIDFNLDVVSLEEDCFLEG